MSSQVNYYNEFGEKYRSDIVSCPEPHYWTTDYGKKGRIYQELKERVKTQAELIVRFFKKSDELLDIGCGFGRQAYLLASKGFHVVGTDTSPVFIEIANQLFKKHNFNGDFLCVDILNHSVDKKFFQVLLLDVFEHIPPSRRKEFLSKIDALMLPKAVLIMSLPHVKKRLTSQLNNKFRRGLTQYFNFFKNREEHPYPIPQKQDILKMIKNHFIIIHFQKTAETDYYVLEKAPDR